MVLLFCKSWFTFGSATSLKSLRPSSSLYSQSRSDDYNSYTLSHEAIPDVGVSWRHFRESIYETNILIFIFFLYIILLLKYSVVLIYGCREDLDICLLEKDTD